jgi:hypothetical protein
MPGDFEIKKIDGNPDMNKYVEELKEDVRLSKGNILEKSLLVGSYRTKWLNYYFKEKDNYKRIKAIKEKIMRSKVDSKVSDSLLKMKSEDNIAKNDENIKKLNKMMENVKENLEFLEKAMNILNDFGFTVKNAIDVIKLERL